jgi:hypothetical protein
MPQISHRSRPDNLAGRSLVGVVSIRRERWSQIGQTAQKAIHATATAARVRNWGRLRISVTATRNHDQTRAAEMTEHRQSISRWRKIANTNAQATTGKITSTNFSSVCTRLTDLHGSVAIAVDSSGRVIT